MMKFELTLSMMKDDSTAVLFHDEMRSNDLTELLARLPLLVIRLRKSYDTYNNKPILQDDDIPF